MLEKTGDTTDSPRTSAESKEGKTIINLIDMDNTIIETDKYNKYFADIISGKIMPPNFFIQDTINFIIDRKNRGEKVAIISHSYIGYKNIVQEEFKKRGIELDAFITIDDVETKLYPTRSKPISPEETQARKLDIISRCGKGKSNYMAKLAFAEMGIGENQYSNIEARTRGDSACDLLLSQTLKNRLNIPSQPIHINTRKNRSSETIDRTIRTLRKYGIKTKTPYRMTELIEELNPKTYEIAELPGNYGTCVYMIDPKLLEQYKVVPDEETKDNQQKLPKEATPGKFEKMVSKQQRGCCVIS